MTYEKLPTLREWQRDSSVAFKVRKDDIVLKRVDDLVEHIHTAPDKSLRFIYLSDLYFTTDYWLKTYPENSLMDKGRAKAMHALFTRAAFDLCTEFECTINGLPRELELMWGRELSPQAVTKDLVERHAEYITRAEAAKYKVYFQNGRAYQYPWWDENARWKRVPVESKRVYEAKAFVTAALKPGAHPNDDYGFFVLTMSRDLYMTKHRPGNARNPGIFHSAYTAGEPTSCAGTMLIRGGTILRIRLDSGHYHPHVNNARALVMALRMRAVPLETVVFEDFNGHPLGYDAEKAKKNEAQDPDMGTLRYVLKMSDTMLLMNATRNASLQKNIEASRNRPIPNLDVFLNPPAPDRTWMGNRPHQEQKFPPDVKKR